MELVFLGTSSMIPTKERNHSTALLMLGKETCLIDCGEGTQRQFRIAGIPTPKITRLLITHWHGDHVLGLPGMIENLSKNQYQKKLEICGPKGTSRMIEKVFDIYGLFNRIQYSVHEILNDGVVFDGEHLTIHAAYLEHSVPCLGYSFQEKDLVKIDVVKIKKLGIPEGPLLGQLQKGKDIVYKGKKVFAKDVTFLKKGRTFSYITDTRYCEAAVRLAEGSQVLACEATHGLEEKEKAEAYMHMTAEDAADFAKKAKVGQLVLTHFSQRYKDVKELLKQAQAIFPNTLAAEDFMRVSVPYPSSEKSKGRT